MRHERNGAAAAPPLGRGAAPQDRTRWGWRCALTVLPVAAFFHHAVFYYGYCMLWPFGREDYTHLALLHEWLWRDPSLPWALAVMAGLFHLGNRWPTLQRLVTPVFPAFLPFAIWIWDIPFSDRFICRHFHDRRFQLAPGVSPRTLHFYALGLVVYVALTSYQLVKARARRREQLGPAKPEQLTAARA